MMKAAALVAMVFSRRELRQLRQDSEDTDRRLEANGMKAAALDELVAAGF